MIIEPHETPRATPRHTVDPHLTVADIVRIYPDAMRVFAKYRVDLCCGGRHPLALVATKHHIPLEVILNELDAAIAVGK